jgi:hypothetical protein
VLRHQVMSTSIVLLGRVLIVSNIGSPTLRVEAEQHAEPETSVALRSGVPSHSVRAFLQPLSYADARDRFIKMEAFC